MAVSVPGQAYNRTRQAYLATDLALADTHWTRFRGLLGRSSDDFRNGSGLWIVPCHGVHTLGMGFPIDVLFVGADGCVIKIVEQLGAWRMAGSLQACITVELPTGSVQRHDVLTGDRLSIQTRESTSAQP